MSILDRCSMNLQFVCKQSGQQLLKHDEKNFSLTLPFTFNSKNTLFSTGYFLSDQLNILPIKIIAKQLW